MEAPLELLFLPLDQRVGGCGIKKDEKYSKGPLAECFKN